VLRKRNTGTPAMEKDARNAEYVVIRVATDPPPRNVRSGANVSRLLAPGRAARLPDSSFGQWRRVSRRCARYSGGAAPALHRFPCPAFAFSCLCLSWKRI